MSKTTEEEEIYKLSLETGDLVREIRKMQGISVEDFAKALNISKTTLWGLETGRSQWTLERISYAAECLNVCPYDLFPGEFQLSHLEMKYRLLIDESESVRAQIQRQHTGLIEVSENES